MLLLMIARMPNPTNIKERLLDLVFPKLCLNCHRLLEEPIDKENLLCGRCFGSIVVNRLIFPEPGFFLGSATLYKIEAARNLIHFLKYEDFPGVKHPIAKIIKAYLRKSAFIDLFRNAKPEIVPVPLYFLKSINRGFNQAEDIAEVLAGETGWPTRNRLLRRIRNTRSQAKLEQKSERLENMAGAFILKSGLEEYVVGKSFIVVDDVYTSGATMSEAIKVLKSGGAKSVAGFVFAKG